MRFGVISSPRKVHGQAIRGCADAESNFSVLPAPKEAVESDLDLTRSSLVNLTSKDTPKVCTEQATTGSARTIAVVLVLTGLANIVLYLFMTIAAHVLSPVEYGLFAAIFGLILLVGILVTGLQTSIAGSVAVLADSDRIEFGWHLLRLVRALTVGVLLITLLLWPLLNKFLHADDAAVGIATALVAAALVPWSAMLGVYQGDGRMRTYSWLTLGQALFRLLAAVVLLWSSNVAPLMFAVGISVLLPTFFAWRYIGQLRTASTVSSRNNLITVPVAKMGKPGGLGWAALTAVAVGFPTIGDVIVVRHVYNPYQVGLFAGIALIGRCVLFLPVAVNSVLYPRYVAAKSEFALAALRRQGLLLTTALSGVAALVFVMFPGYTARVFLGAAYHDSAGLLRIYVVACLANAVTSTLAYYQLARGHRKYLMFILVPQIVITTVLPFIFSTNLSNLVVATLVSAILFLSASALTSKVLQA